MIDLSYQDLQYNDNVSLQYTNFLTTLLLYHQSPTHAIIYNTDSNRQTILILKVSPSGNVTSKRIISEKDKIQLILNRLNRDFPNLIIENINTDS